MSVRNLADPTESASLALARRLRRLRRDAQLTLNDLAERSEVSRAMISKIERGEKSPTFRVLAALATGLGIPTSILIGAETSLQDIEIIRRSSRITFRDETSGFERHLLTPQHEDRRFELVMHVLPAGASTGDLPVYGTPTEKYIVVEEGRIKLTLGQNDFILHEGDSMYFFLDRTYNLLNLSGSRCRYYMASVRR